MHDGRRAHRPARWLARRAGRRLDDAPITDAGPDPRDAGSPDAGQDAGPPIEIVDLCESCSVDEQCGAHGRCVPLTSGELACARLCNPDIPDCPRGFECVQRPLSPGVHLCIPVGVSCCIDEDADGYGTGVGCLGLDCDDSDPDRSPQAPELCNLIDDDCDGEIDEDATDCGPQRCVTADGVSYEEYAPGACVTGECVEPEPTSCGLFTCNEGGEAGDFCATTCERDGADDDSLCIPGTHCDDGECLPDLPNGSACDENSDCESGHCENGFCCERGDCCSATSDCPGGGSFGFTCDDPASCQGSRGQIVCTNFQCTTELGVPDDTACTGAIEANDCGHYRSVYCTGEAEQDPPVCPTSCTDDDACDEGAHCVDNECVPYKEDGEECESSSDCHSGHCADGVCCDNACAGTCTACNLPGLEGTCAPVPANTVPCGMVTCSNYYTGWNIRTCRAAQDGIAYCDGSGACQRAEDVCPNQPADPTRIQVTCNASCQSPQPGTCIGTSPGVCNNTSSGNQTCGQGVCRNTVPICSEGEPVTCMPLAGMSEREKCDGLDNDCDGKVDEELGGDQYEPNNSCNGHTLTKLWTRAATNRPTSLTIHPTIYGSGDVDIYRVDWEENDNSCQGCGGFPWLREDYALRATLTVPAGAGSYQICTRATSCSTSTTESTCRTVTAGSTGTVQAVWKNGTCAITDRGTGYFVVRGQGSPGMQCEPYTLKIETIADCNP